MTANDSYDVAVIGSGPGGYVAAIRAAQLGLNAVCIEKESSLGGTCLNVGCIPSKALLQSSEQYEWIVKHGHDHGIDVKEAVINFPVMMSRKEQVVGSLTKSIEGLFTKNKVHSIRGTASLSDPNTILVNDQKIRAKNIILATGSTPIRLPFAPFDEKIILSSTGALSLKEIPKKMIVIGAGVIGVELASVYRRLGTQVTIIEMLDAVCPGMDVTVSRTLLQVFKKQGIEFFLSSKVTKIDIIDGKAKVFVLSENQNIEMSADVILVAIGRKPNTQGLGLENIGLETNGFISVNGNFQTRYPHIYAIGDLIDGPMLAHKASEEGIAVAEIIAGLKPHVNYLAIPNVIYTHPEAASVGLTEQEAVERGIGLLKGICQFKGNPRARCAGDTDGFVKILADSRSGRVIGLHIVGPHASEMIGEGVVAIESRLNLEEIAAASHAHPTLSEAIKEAALTALGKPIHS